ncbi:MAG: TetR/AcrR family transcriptional regulator [Candidatus Limnocylindria bacterium]
MKPLANGVERTYRSELRTQQAATTRERILDATVRVMAGGLADVTVPAVARAAGVSIPTVYRHFGTKRDLLAALQPHLQQRAGIDAVVLPASIDGLRETLVVVLRSMDGLDDMTRAALASPAAEEVRRVHAPNRFEFVRRVADAVAPQLPAADRDRIARLLVILTTSSALRVWRDHLGASVEQVADEIDRAVRAAIAATSSDAP